MLINYKYYFFGFFYPTFLVCLLLINPLMPSGLGSMSNESQEIEGLSFKKTMNQFYINNYNFYMVREGKEFYTLEENEVIFKGPLGPTGFERFQTIPTNPIRKQMSAKRYLLLFKMIVKDGLEGFIYVFSKENNFYLVKKTKIVKIDFLKLKNIEYLNMLNQFANQGVKKSWDSVDGDRIPLGDHSAPIEYTNIQKTSSWYSFQAFTAIVNNSYMTIGLGYSPYVKLSEINLELSPRFYLAPGKSNMNETFLSYSFLVYLRNYSDKNYFEFGTGIQTIPKFNYTDPVISLGFGYKQRIFLFDSALVMINYITSQTKRLEFVLALEYRY